MNHVISIILPAILFALLIYRRIRRTIGFQKLRTRALYIRSVILSAIGLLVIGAGVLRPVAYLGDAAGMAAGLLLAYLAIRHLSFEQRESQWYYRTHVWVEVLVLVLFLGRFLFDFLVGVRAGSRQSVVGQFDDPLTAGVLILFLCYYVVFAVGLLRRQKGLGRQAAAGEVSP